MLVQWDQEEQRVGRIRRGYPEGLWLLEGAGWEMHKALSALISALCWVQPLAQAKKRQHNGVMWLPLC